MKTITIVAPSLLITACSTLQSTPIADDRETSTGISYFLPKRLHKIKLTATRINTDAANLQKTQKSYEKAAAAKRHVQLECA